MESPRQYGLNCSIVQINELFRCRLCKKTFDTKAKLENHTIKVHYKFEDTFTASNNNNAESCYLKEQLRKKKLEKEQGDHIKNHYPQDEDRIIIVLLRMR